jgi:hypothetical protein
MQVNMYMYRSISVITYVSVLIRFSRSLFRVKYYFGGNVALEFDGRSGQSLQVIAAVANAIKIRIIITYIVPHFI